MTKPIKHTKKKTGGGVASSSGVIVNGVGGRFVASDGLTEKQAKFVKFYTENGGNGADAARRAGYAEHGEWPVLNVPHVRAAIWEARDRLIKTDLASLGVKTLKKLMEDDDTPAHVKFQTARFCVEAAGHVEKAADKLPGASKPLQEMSIAELAEFIKAGKEAMASMKVVDGDVIEPTDARQTGALPALCAS